MSGQLGELVVSLSADIARFREDMGKMQRTSQDAAQQMARHHQDTAKAINNAYNDVASALKGILAGGVIATIVSESIKAGLAVEKMQAQFNAAFGNANSAREMSFVSETANKLGLSLVDASSAYAKFAASARGTSIEGEKTRKIFESVASATTALKLTTDEQNGAFLALSQMMSKGKIQAEELRGQLGERLPGAFKLVADAMGITTAELDKQLQEGRVMSGDVLPKLAEQLDKTYGKAAADAAKGTAAEINRFNNSLMETKAALGTAIMPVMSSLMTNVFKPLTEYTKEFIGGLEIMAVKLAALPDKASAAWQVIKSGKGIFSAEGSKMYEQLLAPIRANEQAVIDDIMAKYTNASSATPKAVLDAQAKINAQRLKSEMSGAQKPEKDEAQLWAQAHDKYLSYLKAFSAKQAEIVKSASQLQQELNQESYDNGLISQQQYLDKKLALYVNEITTESNLKKTEIDRYKNEASKYKDGDSAKDAAAYHEALTKQTTAEKELISLESRLAIVRLQGAQASKQAADARLNELESIKNSTPDRYGNTNEFASRMQDTNAQLKKYQQDEEMKTAILQKSKAQQLAVQQKFDDQMLQSQFDAAGKAADLMVEIGNNSKGAQLAALAIQTTIAVAQIQIAGRVAQMQALAQLGPIAGAAAAAQIEAMMWVNTGLTLAAGVVRGAKIDGARANGGPVTAGQTYIVNENRATQGPEYFTPSVNGYITPANKVNNGQGVSSTTVFQISTGVADTVRAEIARLAPSLAEMSVDAVKAAMRNGDFQGVMA